MNLASCASWNYRDSNDGYAVNNFPVSLERAIPLKEFSLWVVGCPTNHGDVDTLFGHVKSNVIASEYLGIEVLAYEK